MFAVAESAMVKKHKKAPRRAEYVETEVVNPFALAYANMLANGDTSRIQILSPTEVMVWNSPLQKVNMRRR